MLLSKIKKKLTLGETSFYYKMVGVPGLEPGTSSLSEMRSNQLSYTPSNCLAFFER